MGRIVLQRCGSTGGSTGSLATSTSGTALGRWERIAPAAGAGPRPNRLRCSRSLPLPSPAMARVFSGIKPSGDATLGTLLGALRNWVADQGPEAFYCVVDLHALTVPLDPGLLRRQTVELAALMLAVGI